MIGDQRYHPTKTSPVFTKICNWIFERIEYLRGITTPTTSAFHTATQLAGVCRDFAHLAIAFCRSLGIPARFVSAYAHPGQN